MEYLIRVVGHLIEANRPEGFPKQIWSDINVTTEDRAEVRNATSAYMGIIVRQRGIVVDKDGRIPVIQNDLQSDLKDFDSRIFVPYHMISYFETITRPITNSKQQPDQQEGDGEDDIPSIVM